MVDTFLHYATRRPVDPVQTHKTGAMYRAKRQSWKAVMKNCCGGSKSFWVTDEVEEATETIPGCCKSHYLREERASKEITAYIGSSSSSWSWTRNSTESIYCCFTILCIGSTCVSDVLFWCAASYHVYAMLFTHTHLWDTETRWLQRDDFVDSVHMSLKVWLLDESIFRL